ncbi:MAG: excinuclease ABC subunit UvrA [Pirellulaceae bacterium]|jgi:excinuclease ABC subunit A|nr:excinuclease ABC subunit UvrA [Pirellulaceae bacterium]
MPASDIIIKGAREHNLQSVDLVLPRNQLICLTGVSGSGKSSLAFDTLYAEGQRRYVESLSSFARHFLGQMPKPDVDLIAGLSPSISISQKSTGNNPRSTVGTITEIYDYLRVLFARVGVGHCPQCERAITAQSREQIIASILQLPKGAKLQLLAPLIRGQKGEHRDLFDDLLKQGFARARVNGQPATLATPPALDRQMRHNIEVVVDRLEIRPAVRARLAESVDLALKVGRGHLIVEAETAADAAIPDPEQKDAGREQSSTRDVLFSMDYACTHCGLSFEPPSPQLFSFNSPQGMCYECDGLGELFSFDPDLLVPDPSLSFQQGCFALIGKWKELGRWRRHIYKGVARTMERRHELEEGTLLETAWEELDPVFQDYWLWGTGEEHITFTWRGGSSPVKYGGTFDGIIPDLLNKYRGSKSKPQINQLEKHMRTIECPDCRGERLKPQARFVGVTTVSEQFESRQLTLPQVCQLPISRAVEFFSELELSPTAAVIAEEALKEIRSRLGFLMNVGLDYLTLDRTAPTLAGGEAQRIRLAGQIGSGLVGVLYILDEPSIGLHPRDNDQLLSTLQRLRDMGNTVLVVEHDEDTMRAADHIIDFGPGPGVRGGEVVASGPINAVLGESRSVTGQFLSGEREIAVPTERRSTTDTERLVIRGAAQNNLKNVDVEIPLGALVCVTGVSGSGKSSLVNDILVEALRRDLNGGNGDPGDHDAIEGLEHLDKLIAIDQSPIGRTPRSNPGTYIKMFDEIRRLFAQMPESKKRGYKPGRFSFNVKGGRCEACEGNGSNRLEMDFLADVWVTCPVCEGRRFNRETLQVRFKEATIADVLDMDVQQAMTLFENVPKVYDKLRTLHDVGLDYIKIGQPSPTLSGGEAQRIKLARELVKRSTGKTMYLLDEPTTGLHFADIELLLRVLHDFATAGNTVVVVEHNLDVIKTADWIIDLGPEGGAAGGRIVATGTPEQIAEVPESYTGRSLARALGSANVAAASANGRKPKAKTQRATLAKSIRVRGAEQHNLQSIDAKIDRDSMTAFCGPSGSGKTSLAMDTIYAEGQRRYVESLSSYARQFVSQMQKPKVEQIEGLSPAIAIEQRNMGHTPRSTVGTVTEVYDYLRILMARLGEPHCPDCGTPIGTQTSDQIVDKILQDEEGTRFYLTAPVEPDAGKSVGSLWEELRSAGYARVRVDGRTYSLEDPPDVDRRSRSRIAVVIDRLAIRGDARSRIAGSVENALALGRGVLGVVYAQEDAPEPLWRAVTHSQHLACHDCGRSFDRLTPHSFSFNSQLGWCSACDGLGVQTGANPAALLRSDLLSLQDGALLLWPDLATGHSAAMLDALAGGLGIAVETPFVELSTRERRLVMHGAGDRWFDVKHGERPLFRFQFKGLYPALEEASRLSASFRAKLEHLVDEVDCSACGGSRLRDDASAARFRDKTIDQLCRTPLSKLSKTLSQWRLTAREKKIAGELVREIKNRVQFLIDVGLDYISLSRGASTLSNGEAQRIRLASQLGSGLCGVLYVLDEPTIGLHPRDNRRLLKALHKLRDLGNTLLVVEHDREIIQGSDAVCDFGPAAGRNGGRIVASGDPESLTKRRGSVTGPYLSGKKAIAIPANRRLKLRKPKDKKDVGPRAIHTVLDEPIEWLEVVGARHNNLRDVHLQIPLAVLTAVTGPSGSGKSSLINDVLYNSLARRLHRASLTAGAHQKLLGVEWINKVIRVDQQPLGNSPTSNPATYTGLFDVIRNLFAQLPDSKIRGYTARRFSFNVAGGRCEECEGNGQVCIEMHFLPDVWVECETCNGRRYNPETLNVKYRGQTISDVLDMTCQDALDLFKNIPKIRRILQTLCDVGLDYVTLGQPAPTLSGGEAQRVKLAAELSRPDTGQTLYLLDEPTTGLHFDDLAKLLDVLHRLVDLGNTVVIIEHNLDVIKSADWVVDLGPEAGAEGGRIVAEGVPEEIAKAGGRGKRVKTAPRCYTGEALAPVIKAGPLKQRKVFDPSKELGDLEGDLDITEVGRDARMPWEVDGEQWHTVDRVGRKGEPCRWEGRVLAEIVKRVHELGDFSDTDWNARSVVEIAGEVKSHGWFFHAITGEAWLLKMKFRVARGTFKRDELQTRIPLPTLNEMDDIPLYSNDPRVRTKSIRGPWQEVEMRIHSYREIDNPEFDKFLIEAVAGFQRQSDRVAESPEDVLPWKKLGQKWHFLRRGFPSGQRVRWDAKVLEELCEMLTDAAPGAQFLWSNQQIVHLMLKDQRDPWASIHTKRPNSLDLTLHGPKNRIALGRIAELGWDREADGAHERSDLLRIRFRSLDDLRKGDLAEFLEEHISVVKED